MITACSARDHVNLGPCHFIMLLSVISLVCTVGTVLAKSTLQIINNFAICQSNCSFVCICLMYSERVTPSGYVRTHTVSGESTAPNSSAREGFSDLFVHIISYIHNNWTLI